MCFHYMGCDEYFHDRRTEGGNERWKGRKGKKSRHPYYIHLKIPITPIDPRPKYELLVLGKTELNLHDPWL